MVLIGILHILSHQSFTDEAGYTICFIEEATKSQEYSFPKVTQPVMVMEPEVRLTPDKPQNLCFVPYGIPIEFSRNLLLLFLAFIFP